MSLSLLLQVCALGLLLNKESGLLSPSSALLEMPFLLPFVLIWTFHRAEFNEPRGNTYLTQAVPFLEYPVIFNNKILWVRLLSSSHSTSKGISDYLI